MKEDSKILTRRRRFLTGMGVVATGATLAATANTANAQSQSGFTPARHELDAWMDEMSGSHRAFIDSSSGSGGISAMNYANNILTANQDGYGGSDSDYALIVCFRHMSTPLGYNEAMWEKYGEGLGRFTRLAQGDEVPTSNPGKTGGRGIDASIARGIQFAVCDRATQAVSRMLARSTDSSYEDIYQELLNNNIPNSRFVPAGVVAATRAQEYGFSLLYADEG